MTAEAQVPYSCDHCTGPATVGQAIHDGRLHWDLQHLCADGTSGVVQACGRDDTPGPYRQALLDQNGTYRLNLAPGTNRIAAMRVLRAHGIPLTDLTGTVRTGPTGTETEMRLLALHLAEADVATSLIRL
ncbi:MAG TPA: hypothetical protein VN408_06015 [Actinoplanes sp.]|nr:hypothetical protein [Actinoplanes sp.]